MFQKSGDSLAGRYFLFRLNPLTLGEITGKRSPFKDSLKDSRAFIEARLQTKGHHQDSMETLLEFSGFPDPFF